MVAPGGMDGDPRLRGAGHSIGADEYVCHPATGVSISGPPGGYTDIACSFVVRVGVPGPVWRTEVRGTGRVQRQVLWGGSLCGRKKD